VDDSEQSPKRIAQLIIRLEKITSASERSMGIPRRDISDIGEPSAVLERGHKRLLLDGESV